MDKDLKTTAGDYTDLLRSLKERIRSAQIRASLSVNRELVLLYWQIGRDILARQEAQGWGAKVIDRLAADLRKEFPEMKGGSSGFCVGSFSPFIDFLACPLRSLNEIFDPSKATSARSRKLGLRPQTVRARPCGTLP
jgi:hypothetical protein